MKILLVGNPNVGKSVVFSRLTGVDIIASNYAGTTVEYTRGTVRIGEESHELIDTPGAYSLSAESRVEEVTAEMVNEADVIINVLNASNLERNLYLTLELLEKKIPMVLTLNMWDEAKNQGITIDAEKLEEMLGVPVVPTVAVTGEGINELVSRICEAAKTDSTEKSCEERWKTIGEIIHAVQTVEHRHRTLGERVADATIRPLTGIPAALFVMYLTFQAVRLIGEGLIAHVFDPLFELYLPIISQLSSYLGPGRLHDVLIGKLIGGQIDYTESMGLLTTGLYVPFGAVLPYIISFYLILSALEDSGYLPRLATLIDNLFHRLGMHGHGIVVVFLGLGCNVPGVLATRTLETRKQRFIAATLLAVAVPCMAQTAMIFGILGPYGLEYVYLVFATLAAAYVIGGLLLNRFVSGECPEIFLEVPPYRMPNPTTLLKKTWLRVRHFLMEAVPWLFFGILLVNLLYTIGFLDLLGDVFAPVVESFLGLPRGAVAALLVGFLRKDLAVGMLLALGMSPEQLVIATVVLTMYFPCAATFATLLKELGVRDMVKSAAIMILAALLTGGLLRILLS